MALTTRALVLQRIGATDDITSAGGLLITNISGTVGSYSVAIVSTARKLSLSWAAGAQSCTFDLTAAGYTTLTLLASKITSGPPSTGDSPVGKYTASVVPGVSGSTATTLIDLVSTTAIADGTSAILTYSNTSAGTVAALIDNLIDEVSAAIERYCDRTFASASFDERYSGNNGEALVLKNAPVTAIASVDEIDDEGNATTLDATSYRVDSTSGVLWMLGARLAYAGAMGDGWGWGDSYYGTVGPARSRVIRPCWVEGFNNYRVQYTGGYSSTPADLQSVATEMVVDLYMDRRRSREQASRGMGGDNVTYITPDEWVRRNAARLAPFRRVVL